MNLLDVVIIIDSYSPLDVFIKIIIYNKYTFASKMCIPKLLYIRINTLHCF